ncbi:sugar ABC transporter ATP-binding protein [Avibacterium paragallinarum]|uniref:Lantibiotic ABC transporter permease n=1 Tax=Avibacterium paragallinarum TaxID=728 RepID=A0AAE5TI49_AVIPA|nr:sugar ABC transporter ATP-binding protein [Avibacterium paragallinarum]MEE3608454.1 sugar ABC transporter ATP-binding protein [Avibacterium paragallinarum]MEE3620600.1 sugar ABC transporter ATP-binding protein [Avibacterium paragallinarum]MEE3667892.1 sugar ABC transporter ATP-binding protein [Avibacterium paragallinarum]MEE3680147.1 sugar ABC transporter ATP-binding protein [Avibacterium paragallinarum]MEE4385246.1 sugar ABC transporter ATP-binding protein [Avibacterium paragallinarum]
MSEFAIEISNVSKHFGGVKALTNISFNVKKASIHALIGENGAGKSTLMKILSGIYIKDSGTIRVNGEEVNFLNPKSSQKKGIGIIHQELALSPDLSVAENIFLDDLGNGKQTINWTSINKRAKEALQSLGFDISPQMRLGELSVAYQQMVEIAKALTKNVNILILDEPTAVLADPEIDILFENLKKLQAKGVTIIYISHRLEELFRISDAITVIKDGQTVAELDPKASTEDDIIRYMVGREFTSLYPEKNLPQENDIFRVINLSRGNVLKAINFNVKKGEIVGLAGLVGAGRTEVARCIFGIDKYSEGEIYKNEKFINVHNVPEAINHGIGLVPESRKEQGAVLNLSILENMTMATLDKYSTSGIIQHKAEKIAGEKLTQLLQIKLGKLSDPISSLSGGNQQKVVLAKWLSTDCDFIILDEPTRGVDVGAKAEIYRIISDLAKLGYGLLVISSELVELIGLCHRIYVMSDGTITGELQGTEMTEENIMKLAIPKREIAN